MQLRLCDACGRGNANLIRFEYLRRLKMTGKSIPAYPNTDAVTEELCPACYDIVVSKAVNELIALKEKNKEALEKVMSLL